VFRSSGFVCSSQSVSLFVCLSVFLSVCSSLRLFYSQVLHVCQWDLLIGRLVLLVCWPHWLAGCSFYSLLSSCTRALSALCYSLCCFAQAFSVALGHNTCHLLANTVVAVLCKLLSMCLLLQV
jgi:hypothetical protein